jgi:hypothetical protein
MANKGFLLVASLFNALAALFVGVVSWISQMWQFAALALVFATIAAVFVRKLRALRS